jgi:uncharacterized coiled-coil DUF342 family protein
MLDEGFGQAETEGGLVDEERLREIEGIAPMSEERDYLLELVAEVRRLREELRKSREEMQEKIDDAIADGLEMTECF